MTDDGMRLACLVLDWAGYDEAASDKGCDGGRVESNWEHAKKKMVALAKRIAGAPDLGSSPSPGGTTRLRNVFTGEVRDFYMGNSEFVGISFSDGIWKRYQIQRWDVVTRSFEVFWVPEGEERKKGVKEHD